MERVTENNAKPFYVQAVTQPRRVLILDGRPRWETRYLKALFERDERWEVNAIMETTAGAERKSEWERGRRGRAVSRRRGRNCSLTR